MSKEADNWRLMAERQIVPPDSSLDRDTWQQQLADRYLLEVAPQHGALWESALNLLVRYGKPLCYVETPLRQYPTGGPLSTGALAIGQPVRRQGGLVVNAVRLSVANSNVRANHLPVKQIERGAKAKQGKVFDEAVRALGSYAGLTVIQANTMVLATEASLLLDNDALRGALLEGDPPFGHATRMTFGTNFSSDEYKFMAKLHKDARVALHRRPLEMFGHREYEMIRRPIPPDASLPKHGTVEEYQRRLDQAIQGAKENQPYAETLLDVLSGVTGPVANVLGRQAVDRTLLIY